MENTQAMQAGTEAMNAAVQAMSEAEGPTKRNNTTVTVPSANNGCSRPDLKQPTFKQKVQDKYNELLNFEMEVKEY